MDKVLKELKEIREDVEIRFRRLIENMETELNNFDSMVAEISDELVSAGKTITEKKYEQIFNAINKFFGLFRKFHHYGIEIVEGFRESISLHNARSAELARQLTVLPFERMDIILDKFERRLESLECRLQRVEKRDGINNS